LGQIAGTFISLIVRDSRYDCFAELEVSLVRRKPRDLRLFEPKLEHSFPGVTFQPQWVGFRSELLVGIGEHLFNELRESFIIHCEILLDGSHRLTSWHAALLLADHIVLELRDVCDDLIDDALRHGERLQRCAQIPGDGGKLRRGDGQSRVRLPHASPGVLVGVAQRKGDEPRLMTLQRRQIYASEQGTEGVVSQDAGVEILYDGPDDLHAAELLVQ
jgi:hypothetical protein